MSILERLESDRIAFNRNRQRCLISQCGTSRFASCIWVNPSKFALPLDPVRFASEEMKVWRIDRYYSATYGPACLDDGEGIGEPTSLFYLGLLRCDYSGGCMLRLYLALVLACECIDWADGFQIRSFATLLGASCAPRSSPISAARSCRAIHSYSCQLDQTIGATQSAYDHRINSRGCPVEHPWWHVRTPGGLEPYLSQSRECECQDQYDASRHANVFFRRTRNQR